MKIERSATHEATSADALGGTMTTVRSKDFMATGTKQPEDRATAASSSSQAPGPSTDAEQAFRAAFAAADEIKATFERAELHHSRCVEGKERWRSQSHISANRFEQSCRWNQFGLRFCT